MKPSYKIPLAFAVALLRMFCGALYGIRIRILNRSIDTFANDGQTHVADKRLVSAQASRDASHAPAASVVLMLIVLGIAMISPTFAALAAIPLIVSTASHSRPTSSC